MNCVNLLAFIQIAIAFDITLLIFSDSHIFSKIHDSLVNELKLKNSKTIEDAENLEKALNDKLKLQKQNVTPLRRNRAKVMEALTELNYILDPHNTNWSKYSHIGLYSAIYGLLSLFIIGIFKCQHDIVLKNFLLLSGVLTLCFEGMHLIWLNKVTSRTVSYYKIYNKLKVYAKCLLAAGIICLFIGSAYKVPFNRIYVPLAVTVIYMPIVVFIFRMVRRVCQTEKYSRKCSDTVEEITKGQ